MRRSESAPPAICVVCGTALGEPARSRYCSDACRQRAYRMRKAVGGNDRIGDAQPFESSIPGALPAEVDRFVGRRRELDALRKLMRQHRLVSLVGSAGVGKTRLALKALEQRLGSWSDRAALVELDTIRDADLVPQAVAVALGLPGRPGRTVTETVFDALRGGHTILVLDNCEHLVESCAEFAEQALRHCPGLRLLATSREPLTIPGETVFAVNGLSLPADTATASTADLLRCDAVRLFVERARGVVHDFELTDQNTADVAAVCADLDASPLAIELATRWLPMLSIANIRARLHNRFDLLTTSRRSSRERQRSLREAIDWSYELLDHDERTVFRRLSVLVGQFDLDTALTVCVDERLGSAQVLGLLARLQACSLVVSTADANRFRLLESIRMYGRARLDGAGETDAVHDRLVAWLATLAEPLVRQPIWFPLANQRRLETLLGSLQAALRWAESTDDDRYPLLAIATVRCWLHAGYLTEARKLLRSVLERATCHEGYRCTVLSYGGYLATIQGDRQEALAMLEESVRTARALDEPARRCEALYTRGCVQQAAQRLPEAQDSLTEALLAARATGEPLAEAMVLNRLAANAVLLDDVPEAQSLSDRAMAVFDASTPVHALSLIRHTAGTIAMLAGDLDRAERDFAASMRAAGAAWLEVPYAMEGLAMVAERGGRPDRAVRLFSAAKSIRGSDQLFAEPVWRRHVEESIAALWDSLGRDRVDALAAEARELSRSQAVAYALDGTWPDRPAGQGGPLDDGEREVARLAAEGLSNRQIAEQLGISVRSVAYRLRSMRTKVGLRSRADIPAWVADNLGADR
ncbi:ATP-binding protein [Kutzneria sp. CA-103260]|uniref:ATP-binding protein n=1 Tax=Kutzneria sp. CA-103260 TaxID=2802641 RepID=UPI001BAC97BD|nr:LuxR C-terminal-related transcriptional regulator [Kutzneria sp. CA-103260]QUQ65539.1 LuxR family transcriptional regulator [Kutzneria sp. CA-103260]